MTGYRVLPAAPLGTGAVRLVSLRHQDLRAIMDWRNAQMAVLRQSEPLTPEGQERYWQTAVAPGFVAEQPGQILLSVLEGEGLVAYGGLVHIDWPSRRAEVSFLADPAVAADRDRYGGLFAAYLAALKRLAFDHLGLHRLFTETYDLRPYHVAVLEAAGFAPEGRMVDHVRIEGRFVDSLLHGCVRDEG